MTQTRRFDAPHPNSPPPADRLRAERFVENLPQRLDQLVEAALDEDWNEVRRVGDYLAEAASRFGYDALTECAREIADAAIGDNNQLAVKRHILELIGRCGKVRSDGTSLVPG